MEMVYKRKRQVYQDKCIIGVWRIFACDSFGSLLLSLIISPTSTSGNVNQKMQQ